MAAPFDAILKKFQAANVYIKMHFSALVDNFLHIIAQNAIKLDFLGFGINGPKLFLLPKMHPMDN